MGIVSTPSLSGCGGILAGGGHGWGDFTPDAFLGGRVEVTPKGPNAMKILHPSPSQAPPPTLVSIPLLSIPHHLLNSAS